jgi:hypothetical protein
MWRTRRSRDGDARLEARACVADTRAATRGSPLTLNCDVYQPVGGFAKGQRVSCQKCVRDRLRRRASTVTYRDMPILMSAITCSDFVEAAVFVCRVKIRGALQRKLLGSHQTTLRSS